MTTKEIKFRAWDKNRKEMLYSDGDDPNKILINWDFRNNHWKAVRAKDRFVLGKANSILMQYTGLKDKNGKEIYEGDIIKGEWIDLYTGLTKEKISVITDIRAIPDYINCEIIGNIYENPELLKEVEHD